MDFEKVVISLGILINIIVLAALGYIVIVLSVQANLSYAIGDTNLTNINGSYNSSNFDQFIIDCNNTQNASYDKLLCVQPFVEFNFNYVITEDNLNRSVYVTLTEGGDCQYWSELWRHVFDKMNISYKEQMLEIQPHVWHQFDMAVSSDGYCLVDQYSVYCFEYGDFNLTSI